MKAAIVEFRNIEQQFSRASGTCILHEEWPIAEAPRKLLYHLLNQQTAFPGHSSTAEILNPLVEVTESNNTEALYLNSYHIELVVRALTGNPLSERYERLMPASGSENEGVWIANGDLFDGWLNRSDSEIVSKQKISRFSTKSETVPKTTLELSIISFLTQAPSNWTTISVPIYNSQHKHWFCVKIMRKKGINIVKVYDSLGLQQLNVSISQDIRRVLEVLLRFLPKSENQKGWTFEYHPKKTQHNSFDCALQTAMRCAGVVEELMTDKSCLCLRRWLVWAHLHHAVSQLQESLFVKHIATRDSGLHQEATPSFPSLEQRNNKNPSQTQANSYNSETPTSKSSSQSTDDDVHLNKKVINTTSNTMIEYAISQFPKLTHWRALENHGRAPDGGIDGSIANCDMIKIFQCLNVQSASVVVDLGASTGRVLFLSWLCNVPTTIGYELSKNASMKEVFKCVYGQAKALFPSNQGEIHYIPEDVSTLKSLPVNTEVVYCFNNGWGDSDLEHAFSLCSSCLTLKSMAFFSSKTYKTEKISELLSLGLQKAGRSNVFVRLKEIFSVSMLGSREKKHANIFEFELKNPREIQANASGRDQTKTELKLVNALSKQRPNSSKTEDAGWKTIDESAKQLVCIPENCCLLRYDCFFFQGKKRIEVLRDGGCLFRSLSHVIGNG